jgi:hypothetical protein
MSGRGDGTRAELEIVRLCRAGLDRSALRQQLMVLLRRLLPVDAVFLAAADRLPGPPSERRIAVVVETAEASAAASMLLSAHGLTAREAEVARLVCFAAPLPK